MSSNAFCHCHPAPSGPSAPVAPDYKEKMVAVSAILNPETVAINTYASAEVKKANKKLKTETKVILFQSLYNGTVGYDQVSFEPHDKLHSRQKGDVVGFYGEKGVPTLKFRSTLTSVLVNNLVHTYGVFSDNSVWLVSPIYTPLDKAISTYGIIASTISPKTGRGSLFWQDPKGHIVERDTTSGNSNVLPVKGTNKAKAGTSIAAINDGTTRYLIYQDSNEEQNGKDTEEVCSIIVRNIETLESNPAAITGSINVIDTTVVQIAAVYASSESGRYIFVYHTDKKGIVYRSQSSVVAGQALKFTKTEPLEPTLVIEKFANLSVLASDGKNIIYTAKSDSDTPEITYIEDEWN